MGQDVEEAASPLHVSADQDEGCKAVVHAMRHIFHHTDTEGVLLVDATNGFNTINRQADLQNISVICPSIAQILIYTYKTPVMTVIVKSGENCLNEGHYTKRSIGDGHVCPGSNSSNPPVENRTDVEQAWFADDATSAVYCNNLKAWWDDLTVLGPTFGYYLNGSKTHLVVKPEHEEMARQLFTDNDVNISIEGKYQLNAALGSRTFTEEYVINKLQGWIQEITCLAKIATTQLHAAYATFTHGPSSRWSYISSTIPDIHDLLLPLETTIHQCLIPALTGRAPRSRLE